MNSGLNNAELHPQQHDGPPAERADEAAYDLFPVSFAQLRLWFLHQLDPSSAEYNVPAAVRLHGTLDVDALEASLQAIVARHETLRTTFVVVDDQPMQRIAPDGALLLKRIELRQISDDDVREAEARRLAMADAQQPFDLWHGPLLRATLLHLADHDNILLLTLHHVVADGWSIGVFVRELATYYAAYVTGQPAALPELPIQYADFAVWQRHELDPAAPSAKLTTQLAYWQRQLRPGNTGTLPVVELPSDTLPSASSNPRGARHTFTIAPPLMTALDALSRHEQVTLFMTLLAAFNVLLARYTGQTDLLVGTPIVNRSRAELEGLIGFFTNTLVVRSDLGGDPPFRELLSRVRATLLDAYDHQDVPFEKLVEVLQPDRDVQRSPLFQVMFAMQKAPLLPIQLQHLTLSPLDIDPATAKFDLLLTLSENKQGLAGVLEYRADRLTPTMIARLAEHYQTLLHSIAANPNAPVSELTLISAAEQQQIIARSGASTVSDTGAINVVQLFEAQVTRSPQSIAAATDTRRLTYAELNTRANQLAHYLWSQGVGPGARVALALERSLELLISVLGVLKAGAAYVPLDPTYPQERLAYILTSSQVTLILTQQAQADRLPDTAARYVYVDSDASAIQQAPTHNPASAIEQGQLAYVIYTSGSTGQPKGVAMPHRPLTKLIDWHLREPALSQPARTLHFAPISFDVSFQELFSCWGTGGTLLIAADDLRRDPSELLRWMDLHAVERLFVPFVALHQLAEAATTMNGPARYLREIITAGEQLQITAALRSWLHRLPNCTLYNHYGPTEAHVVASYQLTGAPESWPALPPIGRPVAGARLYVLEPQLQMAPIGVAGEPYIGGAALAQGYLDRPALTAELFIPDPFAADPGARLYRTGDLARYLADGTIEFLGRIDDQVKVRGFRIEPGEIEGVLRLHPAVRDAVVLGQRHDNQTRLVAYVVGEPREEPRTGALWANLEAGDATDSSQFSALGSGSELRAFLQQRLPEYMIPSAFVMLPALPLTPSGKVNRLALSDMMPDVDQRELDERFVAPQSPLEELLAGIWSSVLGHERIGIHDHFFAIGGHSLLATQIISRIRTTLNVDVPLRTLFEAPTIAAFAAQVEQARHNAREPLPPLQPLPRGRPFPLSFAQQRLWFLAQMEPDSAAYSLPFGLRLAGDLHVPALEHALQALVARHETLRTTFTQPGGEPAQVIGAPYGVTLSPIDLQHAPDREARMIELASAEERRPFDLAHDPPLRVALLRLGPTEHVLLLTMHHIISDGWSMRILINELAVLYRAATTNTAPLLRALPIQYADFAVWQRETMLHTARLQQQLAYWRHQLADAPTVLELPIALPRLSGQALQSAAHSFVIGPSLTAELRALSRRQHVTLFMTLLAAFNVVLYRYTGQTDLLVGTPTAGRTQHDIEQLIGFFINTLVLRCDLSGNPSFVTLLQRMRETALQAYAHQDLPFEQVVKEVQPERALHQQPLVQTVFVFQSTSLSTPELPDLTLSMLDTGTETAKFDLTLFVEGTDQGLNAVFKYNQALFPTAAIERLAAHWQTLLSSIVAQPQQRIGELPMLTAAEYRQIVGAWNATATPYPVGQCYHQLFEAQAARTPAATAVIFGTDQLSYADLNQRANQLAHHLRAQGVGRHAQSETRIGICAERSIELVVALLGVLKAGGAYVPLDPAYPAERLQFMLEDAQVGLLLTQQRLVARLPQGTARHVLLDADWPSIAQQPAHNPPSSVTVANLAYVIYTSGSTGVPKGVMVTHEGIGNLAAAQIRDFRLGPGSRVLQFVSFSFDGAVSEFIMALLSGATLCLALPGSALPGPALIEQLQTQAVTTMKLPPSVLAVLPPAELPTLRTVISAGEQCSAELVKRWRGEDPSAPRRSFFNAYGPSENTVCATIGECSGIELRPHVGRPLPNKQIYLLDRQLQPVPVGVPGELHIGGIGLARGYLDRPALTAEKFIPHPFVRDVGAAPGTRLYKTGDLARYLADGNIEFLGRIDDQVKVRGFRIELGEIEAVLRQHPAVRGCVAIVREDQPGDRRVVAYIVGEPGAEKQEPGALRANSATTEQASDGSDLHPSIAPDSQPLGSSSLRDFLQTKLPGYMIPSAFVELAALPLTPNGKIDRAALPAPSPVRPELDTAFVAPRSWIEQTLARIWAEVLRLEQVGVHDNFFDLGGDSILSIQITARTNQAGLRVTPKQLFEHQTVAELAEVVGTQQAIQAEQGLVTGPVPLTPIQRYFFEQEQPEPHHWNQSLLLATREQLDPDRLTQALHQIQAHHDALRLRFVRTVAGWQQRNADLSAAIPSRLVDLAGLPPDEQTATLEAAAATFQAQLQLEDGTLVQAVLFDLGPQHGSRLLLVVHHLVVDGVSWRVLLEDLETAYRQLGPAISRPAQIQLPPKTTAYQQWAERLVQHAQSAELAAAWSYWRSALPAQIAPLPVDRIADRTTNREGVARSVALALEADETWTLLHEVPKVYHTQINDLLLTALVLTFNHHFGLRMLLVDLESQGREPLFDDIDVSRTVGWFTAVFPILLRLPDAQRLDETLTAVKEQLRSIPQRGIGYSVLRYLSDQPTISAELRAQPQAEVGFNYLGQFAHVFNADALFQLASESSGPARSAQAKRLHLLDINAGVFKDRLHIEWTYSPAHYQHATIDALAHSFCDALRQLIAHCLGADVGGYTPSDFAAFNWSQADLDDITSSIGKLMGDS